MSASTAPQSECHDASGTIALRIEPKEMNIGDFSVRRVLPSPVRRMVGPFIFFDHMGPAEFPPGKGIQVRPHPHIGIATITYLFEGEIIHRDSLGVEQPIRPGAVNLMLAGRGIVHSERAGDDLASTSRLHGIQSWIALPDALAESVPTFRHHPKEELPQVAVDAAAVRVILGEAFGKRSPVQTYSPTRYLECKLPAGAVLTIPDDGSDLAAYVVDGAVRIDDQSVSNGVMVVARAGASLRLEAQRESQVMVIGGAPLGERHIWWNFVASSRERIEEAKADWRAQRFGKVAGDDEFIPLPE